MVAAASKSMRRARRFQQLTGVGHIYDSYEAMLENEDLDAVYIATTHNFHADNARLCLAHNLPILIEKPLAQNARQAAEIIMLARQKNLFMMEAMWTRFTPATTNVRALLAEGVLGDIKRFSADFCIRMSLLSPKMRPWNRMHSRKLAGGALLDIGIYPVAYARMIFGRQPGNITSSAKMSWTGVDTISQYMFDYPDGARAEMRSAFVEAGSCDATIEGSRGILFIPRFYRADRLVLRIDGREEIFEHPEPNFVPQIQEMHRSLREGLTESPLMPLDESLETMQTLDAIRAQWGMSYPGD